MFIFVETSCADETEMRRELPASRRVSQSALAYGIPSERAAAAPESELLSAVTMCQQVFQQRDAHRGCKALLVRTPCVGHNLSACRCRSLPRKLARRWMRGGIVMYLRGGSVSGSSLLNVPRRVMGSRRDQTRLKLFVDSIDMVFSD